VPSTTRFSPSIVANYLHFSFLAAASVCIFCAPCYADPADSFLSETNFHHRFLTLRPNDTDGDGDTNGDFVRLQERSPLWYLDDSVRLTSPNNIGFFKHLAGHPIPARSPPIGII
jgi:hypothetical protein